MVISARINVYETLNNAYKFKNGNKERPLRNCSFLENASDLKNISKFSVYGDDFKLPLLVKGTLITAGEYDDNTLGKIVITPDELKKSLGKWIGIEGYKHHGVYESIMKGMDIPIDGIVSKIVKTMWNDENNSIDFFAEIYDADLAYKALKGLVKYVSAGFARDINRNIKENKAYLTNIEPKEYSHVFRPRDKNAIIHPVM